MMAEVEEGVVDGWGKYGEEDVDEDDRSDLLEGEEIPPRKVRGREGVVGREDGLSV